MNLSLRSPRQRHWQAEQIQRAERSHALPDVCTPNVSTARSVTDCNDRSQPVDYRNPEMQRAWQIRHCVTSSKASPSQISREAMIGEAPNLMGGL